MLQYLTSYGATALAFLVLDGLWLGVIAKDFYRSKMGTLMADQINMPVAVSFYALFVAGLTFFAVIPGLQNSDWKIAALYGALFGFFAYATYNLTNMATIRGWPYDMSLVDLCWGTVLSGLSASSGYMAAQYFLKA
jgi:uncharacterized membrane protein